MRVTKKTKFKIKYQSIRTKTEFREPKEDIGKINLIFYELFFVFIKLRRLSTWKHLKLRILQIKYDTRVWISRKKVKNIF